MSDRVGVEGGGRNGTMISNIYKMLAEDRRKHCLNTMARLIGLVLVSFVYIGRVNCEPFQNKTSITAVQWDKIETKFAVELLHSFRTVATVIVGNFNRLAISGDANDEGMFNINNNI